MSIFDHTNDSFFMSVNNTVDSTGDDLSEFDNDSRGTARVADWSDFENMSITQFDNLVSDLSISNDTNDVIGWISWEDSTFTAGENGNKYYRDPAGSSNNTRYALHLNNSSSDENATDYDSHVISTSPRRELYVTSTTGAEKVIVTFDSTAGALGDPHIKTFDGTKYTL